MGKNARLLLTITTLAIAAPFITACNTTSGAGEDISAAGKSIKQSADRNNPYNHPPALR